VVTSKVIIVQCYWVALYTIVVTAKVVIVQLYCVVLEFFVVTETVDILQWYCVVCLVYNGYSNSRYSAMVLCCVWILLWLQQQ